MLYLLKSSKGKFVLDTLRTSEVEAWREGLEYLGNKNPKFDTLRWNSGNPVSFSRAKKLASDFGWDVVVVELMEVIK